MDKYLAFVLTMTVFSLALVGCGPEKAGPSPTPSVFKSPRPVECPRLESQLYQLVTASDPEAAAKTLGIELREGKVQIVVELAGQDRSALVKFGVQVGKEAGQRVQGLAPYRVLCDLANAPGVQSVRLPAKAELF